jgi:predicted transposase/invertase (TIGR01784 family)
VALLKRTTDIVFKLLFVRHPESLRYMLSVILGEEVAELTILNPEIPGHVGEGRDEKVIVLDVRVRLGDGRRVIVEMQMRTDAELGGRLVYYAARDLSSGLSRGETYGDITPTVLVVWLGERMFPRDPEHLHRIAEMRVRGTGELVTDVLAVHVLQLKDFSGVAPVNASPREQALWRWARFFQTESEAEMNALAKEDPEMRGTVETIKATSEDPETQRLATEAEMGAFFYRRAIKMAQAEGQAEGQAALIIEQLESKFGPLDPGIESRVSSATSKELSRWAVRLLTAASVAEVFE